MIRRQDLNCGVQCINLLDSTIHPATERGHSIFAWLQGYSRTSWKHSIDIISPYKVVMLTLSVSHLVLESVQKVYRRCYAVMMLMRAKMFYSSHISRVEKSLRVLDLDFLVRTGFLNSSVVRQKSGVDIQLITASLSRSSQFLPVCWLSSLLLQLIWESETFNSFCSDWNPASLLFHCFLCIRQCLEWFECPSENTDGGDGLPLTSSGRRVQRSGCQMLIWQSDLAGPPPKSGTSWSTVCERLYCCTLEDTFCRTKYILKCLLSLFSVSY